MILRKVYFFSCKESIILCGSFAFNQMGFVYTYGKMIRKVYEAANRGGLRFFLQYLIYLIFHIMKMGSLPENSSATRTEGKGLGMLVDKGDDQVLSFAFGELL